MPGFRKQKGKTDSIKRKSFNPSKFKNKSSSGTGAPRKNYVTGGKTTQSLFPRNKKALQSFNSRDVVGLVPPSLTGYTRDFRANSIVAIERENTPTLVRNAASDCTMWFNGYQHWTVIGSKCTVNFRLKGGESKNLYCGVRLTSAAARGLGDGTASSVGQDMRASKTGKVMTLTPERPSGSLSLKFSAKKEYGGSVMGNSRLNGSTAFATNSTPTDDSYFQVMAVGTDPNDAPTFEYSVRIDYVVIYTEPIARGYNTLPTGQPAGPEVNEL